MQAHHAQPNVNSARRPMSKLIALTCGLIAWVLGVPAQAFYTPGQFGVSPTGAANYSIPIAVPPGTAGMVPSLSINYNSQGGNGLLGVGWSLSGLSAITRCPKTVAQDGARAPVKYDATDRYCLDGQRLALWSGIYGADGAEYRTERESFSRIVSYGSSGSPASGVGYFKVWTKAGLIMEYGNTSDSLIEQQGKSSVQVWALKKVTDTLGNYYTVSYQDNGNASGEFYPTRIDYTGNAKTGLQPYNWVRFEYQTRTDSPVMYDRTGSQIRSTQRLIGIQTHARVGNADTLVKAYKMQYEYGRATGRSRITSITECDGTGTPAGCLAATTIAWDATGDAIADASAVVVNSGAGWNSLYRYTGDFNGDGKLDLLAQSMTNATLGYICTGLTSQSTFACPAVTLPAGIPGKSLVADFNSDGYADYFNNGTLCHGPALTTCVATNVGAPKVVYAGNVNGDQYPDVIFYKVGQSTYHSGDGWSYQFSRGYCLGPDLQNCIQGSVGNFLAQAPTLPPNVADITMGDFNADGKTDLLYTTTPQDTYLSGVSQDSGIGTYLCSGEAIGQGTAACTLLNTGSWGSLYKPYSVDFNGDGISDLLLASDSGSYYCPGPGIAAAGSNNCQPIVNSTGWKTTFNLYPGDYNGDGISDLYLVGTADSSFCAGSGLLAATGCAKKFTGDWKTLYDIRPDDYDGDGTTDLLLITDTARSFVEAGVGHADRVAGITNGLGAATSISYKPLTDATVYAKGTGTNVKGAGYLEIQAPMYVVSSVSTSNGIGGTVGSSYYYWRARAHLDGGGFMGFEVVRSCDINVTPNICTQTQYIQDYPYQGLAKQVIKFAMNSGTANYLNVVTNTWAYVTADPAIQGPVYHVPQLTKSQEVTRELAAGGTQLGSVVTNVITSNTYDEFGNPLVITVSSVDASVTPSAVYKKTTTNTYDNLVGSLNGEPRWLLGRLRTAKVTSTTP